MRKYITVGLELSLDEAEALSGALTGAPCLPPKARQIRTSLNRALKQVAWARRPL